MRRWGVIVGILILLSGCDVDGDPFANFPFGESRSSGSILTFPQRVRALIDMGRSAATQTREAAENIRGRVGKVQSGVHLLLEGKEMIEDAVR